MKLLFPGRHLLHTRFQEEYLARLLQTPVRELEFLDGKSPEHDETIDELVIAITSSNHGGSRFNPIDYEHRILDADRFANRLRDRYDLKIKHRIVGIPHYLPTDRFVDYLLKEVHEGTDGKLDLTPQNTIFLISTP